MNRQDTSRHAGHTVHLHEEGVTAYSIDLVTGDAIKISNPVTEDVYEWTLWCTDCQTAVDPVDLGMDNNSFDIV